MLAPSGGSATDGSKILVAFGSSGLSRVEFRRSGFGPWTGPQPDELSGIDPLSPGRGGKSGKSGGVTKILRSFSGAAPVGGKLSDPLGTMTAMTGSRICELADELLSALDFACAPAASGADMVAALRDYGSVKDRLAAAEVRLIGSMARRGVFSDYGYRRPEYAIAELLGWDRRPARRRVRLAERVCERVGLDGQVMPAYLRATASAFTEGRIGVAQAEVIAAVLDGPAARRLHPNGRRRRRDRRLRRLDRLHPERDRRMGEAADRSPRPGRTRTRRRTRAGQRTPVDPRTLRHRRLGQGRARRAHVRSSVHRDRGTVQAATGHRPDLGTTPSRRPGRDLRVLLRHHGSLPETGGERPQIRVTLDWERLRDAVARAHLDTGAWYSPGQLRMLACDACVVPAVLGSNSEPLDVGRQYRIITAAIRRAVAIRDGGCTYPGCNRPPARCDVHHCTEWADGGVTTVHNCTMLCPGHHRIVYGAKWTVRIRDAQPELIPPEFIDQDRRIRRRPQRACQPNSSVGDVAASSVVIPHTAAASSPLTPGLSPRQLNPPHPP